MALGTCQGGPGSNVSPAPERPRPRCCCCRCFAPPSPGAGNEAFVKLIKTTEARRKGKLISHGNQLDLIQKNKQRVRSVSLAGCFSGKGITRRFPPKGMALCCCSLCNWGFRSGTKSHYHEISLSEGKKLTFVKRRREQQNKADQSALTGKGLP